jgi:hypothetical protein
MPLKLTFLATVDVTHNKELLGSILEAVSWKLI